jgi:hypothetical protein
MNIFLMGKTNIGNVFTLMCIIQNTLWHYIRETINVNPVKLKIMKLAYWGKTNMCPLHFKLSTIPNERTIFHHEL